LKTILIASAALVAFATVGCSSSAPADDGTIKPGSGVALNPTGKPQTAADAQLAEAMQKTGAAMNAQQQKDAAAMAAARAAAGGK
jgi:hypothetical protein